MKKCIQCNLSYDDKKNFCKKCGNALLEEQKLYTKTAVRKTVLEDKLKADPLNTGLLHEYAALLTENGEYKTAVEVLMKLLAINENDNKAARMLFFTYIALENHNDATEIGDQLLSANPNDVEILSVMAQLFYESGEYDKAISYSENALAVQPSNTDALNYKALSKLKQHALKEALPLFDQLMQLGQFDDITALYAGVYQLLSGNHETAVKLLTGVLSKEETTLASQDIDRGLVHLCHSLLKTNASMSEFDEWFSIIDFDSFENHIHELDEQSLADTIYMLVKNKINEWKKIDQEVVDKFTSKYMVKPQACITGSGKNKLAAAWIMLADKLVDLRIHTKAKDSLDRASKLLSEDSDYMDEHVKVSKWLKVSIRRRNKKTLLILVIIATAIAVIVVGMTIKNRLDENKAWEEAVEKNTFLSYDRYINQYSEGNYVLEAIKLQDELAWAEAVSEGTLNSYLKYIERLPNGRHVKNARDKLTFVDERDGKKYKFVKIGSQFWMAENLNYDTTEGSWCYGNEKDNCTKFGRLYNYQTALTVCPTRWHLPSDQEWNILTDYLGGRSVAGGKLKEAGSSHWASPNTDATNSSGFSALSGGYRSANGSFYDIGGGGA